MTDLRKSMKCNPRDVRWFLRKLGSGWFEELPWDTVWGVDREGRCWYWLAPERASKPFEKKLGAMDLDYKGRVFDVSE